MNAHTAAIAAPESVFVPPLPPVTMTKIKVKFTFEGFHRWPEAQGQRGYLSTRHRHIFHITVGLQVFHGDREVEIHDLRDECLRYLSTMFVGGELGRNSCEDIASLLVNHYWNKYQGQRWIMAEVLEDDENGASVETPFPAEL